MDLTEEEVASLAAAPGASAVESRDSVFDVVLEDAGQKQIEVIKVVRALTSCGLKEARILVQSAPAAILESVSKEDAEAAVSALRDAGATTGYK